MTRFVLDPTTRRVGRGDVVLGGSPLRLFRLSPAGTRVFERLAAGDDVGPSRLVDRLLDAGAIHPRPLDGPYTPGDVTVVVPALEAPARDLGRIVRACAGVAAVVVVDDGSDPPLAPVPGALMVRLRANSGPAAARNLGSATVTTPLVAFVDTDVRLPAGWLPPLLAHFADERVVLVAPRVASVSGRGAVARYEQRHSPLDLGPRPGRIAPGTRVSYVPAAAVVARTAALAGIGGFDEQLRVGEDVDAVWRLLEAGWRARYEPAVVVEHVPRAGWRALAAQRVAYGSSSAPLARRHRGALAPLRMSGWSAGVWALVLAGRPLAAVGLAAGTAGALVPKLRGVPATESLRLAGLGHLHAGWQIAAAARRAWWPALVAGALVSRRARRWAVAAALPALARGGPARLLDDLAYGAGVWSGVRRERHPGPLVPQLAGWPRRGDA